MQGHQNRLESVGANFQSLYSDQLVHTVSENEYREMKNCD